MTSKKQIAANRRNAGKSTGPRTPEGKAKVSMNAVKHGLTAESVLIPGEDPEELGEFREGLLVGLAPLGDVELFFADLFVRECWRLRRLAFMEAEIVAEGLRRWREFGALEAGEEEVRGAALPELSGTAVAAKLLRETDVFPKLGRYGTQIERSVYRALHQLERLQADRRGREVAAPVVLDVNVTGIQEGSQP